MDYTNNSKDELLHKLHELEQELKALEISHEYEIKYRSLIENISDVVFEIDFKGIITYISPTIEKLLGYTQQDVIGKSFLHFVGENAEYLAERFKVLRDKGTIDNDYRIVSKNGEVHWLRFSTKAILEDGIFKGGLGTLVDITENMLSRIALQESEALYLSILHASPDVITITDLEGNIKFSSPKAIEMFGLKKHNDTDGHSLFEFIAPKDHKRAKRNVEKMFQGEFFGAEEYMGVRVDGSNFDIEVNGEFIKDAEGKHTGMIFITRDITERKITKEKLKKSEETFRYLVETVNDAIYEVDNSGVIKYVSPAIEKIVGYTPEELIGKNFFEYMYPDDRPLLMEALTHLADKDSSFLEYRYLTKEGKVQWVRSSTAPNIRNGVLIGGTGSLTNINDRKLAEDELRKLSLAVEQSPATIVITDLNANVEYVNPAFEATTGYSFAEVVGKSTKILQSGKTDPRIYQQMWKTITNGEEWNGEWINKKKNGEFFWESILITPIHNENNVITNYLAVKQDITNRKQTENEIRDLNANLELKIKERTIQLAETNNILLQEIEERKKKEVDLQVARIAADKANLAKSEFLSRMSHELRTPMNSILGFAQLLEMSDLNKSQKKGVNHIMKSGKHLLDLINEVLDISRIEAGRLSLSIEPVHLNSIIQEAIDIVRIQASERQISIELVDAFDANSYVKSDRQRLKQVMLNLMNNAIKYNKTGGSVVIKSEIRPKNEGEIGMIRISVIDSGFGLASEDIPKLFVPFERVGAEKTATEGTGLGLAVVKKLVGAMGGNLGVESELGVGSIFWIELPQSESHTDTLKRAGILDAIDSIISEKTGTILYIEDNNSNIELVEQILTSQRTNIRLVTSLEGRRTLDLAVANNPDLILLDLNLPDIHGSEVINLLMQDERTKHIPVVIISADAMPHQLDRLIHAGAKKYLTKPLDVTDFLTIIDEYIK